MNKPVDLRCHNPPRWLPARLPRYLQHGVSCERRQIVESDRQHGAPDDARRLVRQTQRLRKTSLSPRSFALPDETHRPQRQQAIYSGLAGMKRWIPL